MPIREITAAAIQMVSANRDVAGNLARATSLVAEAASQGAELVLLPEMFASGFELNDQSWRLAEPQGGACESWLCAMGRRHGIIIGGSYLEARGDDFHNTFALALPDGTITGRVRKSHPCSLEAYVFKDGLDANVLETPLGRLGVAICYDGSLRDTWDRMLPLDPDLVLMPLSAPLPMKSIFYRDKQIAAFKESFREAATLSARGLGIPFVLANKWGPWNCVLPGGFRWLPEQKSIFPGFSHIADSDGTELARMADREGVIVAKVRLDPARKHLVITPEADRYRPWVHAVPPDFKTFAWFERLGKRWYGKHPERAVLARMAVEGATSSQ